MYIAYQTNTAAPELCQALITYRTLSNPCQWEGKNCLCGFSNCIWYGNLKASFLLCWIFNENIFLFIFNFKQSILKAWKLFEWASRRILSVLLPSLMFRKLCIIPRPQHKICCIMFSSQDEKLTAETSNDPLEINSLHRLGYHPIKISLTRPSEQRELFSASIMIAFWSDRITARPS